jgi:protein-disulfide isomerase
MNRMRILFKFAITKFSVTTFAVTLLLSSSLFAQAVKAAEDSKPVAPAGAPSVELVQNYFQRAYGYDPNLKVSVAAIQASTSPELFEVVTIFASPDGQQVVRWYVTRDLKHVIAGELRPFGADPYVPDRAVLAAKAFGATRGPVNAKVLIVEFADLECPSCREAQAIMQKLYADFPDARFIFQNYPLASLHPWAARAASYVDCIARQNQDKAFAFIDGVYGHQREIESIVRRTGDDGKVKIDDAEVTGRMKHYTEVAGADVAKTQACADLPETAERIKRSVEVGRDLGVSGTPTLYVNGRLIGNPGSLPYEALKAIVQFEVEQAGK